MNKIPRSDHNPVQMLRDHVLVTGGSGYVGSCVARLLASRGYLPIIYDSAPPPIDQAVYVKGDVRDRSRLAQTFGAYKPTCVIHLAAQKSIVDPVLGSEAYYSVNVEGGRNVLDMMKEFGCRNIIFSSSAAVYKSSSKNIKEVDAVGPLSVYGKTKLDFEHLLKREAKSGNVSCIVLRLFNVGGYSRRIMFSKHRPQSTLIVNSVLVSLRKKKKLSLYGSDLPTRDGSAQRDYVHVLDVADAVLASFLCLLEKEQNTTINIGSGKGTTNLEVVKAVEQMTHSRVPLVSSKIRPQEVVSAVADIQKACDVLRWKPTQSSLQSIIQSVVEVLG